MKRTLRALQRHEWMAVALLLMLGAALRLLYLGSFPPGLNQDEASAGYEAWSLLHYGMDRCGNSFPVLFVSWGSGQNVLYSYLSIPWIALFGLSAASVRLTAGLCGTASLLLFYALARRLRGGRCALWALLALAINPWHVLLSRWALESNLLPCCLLAALYFLVRAREREGWLLAAAAALGLSLYAYGTAFVFLPLFLLPAAVLLWRRETVSRRCFILSMALFVLLALPITVCNVRNVLGMDGVTVLGVTLPALTETRQSTVTIFGGGGWRMALQNFQNFMKLLWTQSDGLLWNSAGAFGLFYGKVGLALAALGLGRIVWGVAQRRVSADESYLLLWMLAAALSSFLIDINVNRMNMAFLPLVYCQAVGLSLLGRRAAAPLLCALALAAGAFFSRFYFTDYAENLAPSFYAGLDEAIVTAAGLAPDEPLWLTWDITMPYIYVLFYEQIPPGEYLESVTYMNPDGAFRWVTAFSRYRFGYTPPDDGTVCIVRTDKLGALTALAVYGEWAVAR